MATKTETDKRADETPEIITKFRTEYAAALSDATASEKLTDTEGWQRLYHGHRTSVRERRRNLAKQLAALATKLEDFGWFDDDEKAVKDIVKAADENASADAMFYEHTVKPIEAPVLTCAKIASTFIAEAAREYRRDQARAIIRTFHFEVRVEEIGAVSVVAYVPDSTAPGRMRSTASVRKPDDVAALFQTELRQLLGVAARVLGIAEAKRGVLGDEAANAMRSVCSTIKAAMSTPAESNVSEAA